MFNVTNFFIVATVVYVAFVAQKVSVNVSSRLAKPCSMSWLLLLFLDLSNAEPFKWG